MSFKLGGFAEYEDEIDGDFNAFNFCLAEEYMTAIIEEDFDALGFVGYDLIEKITYWLNYNGTIGKDVIDKIEGIKNGNIITINNRTFIDALYTYKKADIAEMYIVNRGIIDSKLFLTCILYGEEKLSKIILNEVHYFIKEKEEYIGFLNDVFSLIEQEFNIIDNVEDKKQFLNKIKQSISNITYPKKYGEIDISIKEYNWGKQYKKEMNTK